MVITRVGFLPSGKEYGIGRLEPGEIRKGSKDKAWNYVMVRESPRDEWRRSSYKGGVSVADVLEALTERLPSLMVVPYRGATKRERAIRRQLRLYQPNRGQRPGSFLRYNQANNLPFEYATVGGVRRVRVFEGKLGIIRNKRTNRYQILHVASCRVLYAAKDYAEALHLVSLFLSGDDFYRDVANLALKRAS